MTRHSTLAGAELDKAFEPEDPEDRRMILPLPLDKTWLRGIEAESEAALKLARKVLQPDRGARA